MLQDFALEYARRTGCTGNQAMEAAFEMALIAAALFPSTDNTQQDSIVTHFTQRLAEVRTNMANPAHPGNRNTTLLNEWLPGPSTSELIAHERFASQAASADFGQAITTDKAHKRFMRIK